MALTQVVQPGRQIIERYAASGFRVSGVIYSGAVLVFAEKTLVWEPAELTVEALEPVVAHGDVEILLLGLGRRMLPVPTALRTSMKACGVALEAMDTGAACRTYNLLLGEDRRVAAALLPPV